MEVKIVLPICRDRYLTQFFAALSGLECDLPNTKLLVYVDGDIMLFEKVQRQVASCKIRGEVVYRNRGIANVSSVRRRRQRIADIHNELKTKIGDCQYVLLLEDDTLVPHDALSRLIDDYNFKPNAGFVSGIEIGRWGFPMIGAWDMQGDTIWSVEMETGLQRVDAAGFYCCLVKRENYVNHEFKPFEQILGPDVDFGFSLLKKGIESYVDYDIKCDHLTEKEPLTFDTVKTIQVKYTRDSSNKLGWSQEIISDDEDCEVC